MGWLSALLQRLTNDGPNRGRLQLEALEPRLLLDANPIIAELMAINNSTLADEDGEFSDWEEIQNTGDASVDLAGWHLTDDEGDLTQWTFPSLTLDPEQALVVFASGKDRAVAGGELHTNFSLSGAGEYLALVRPDGATVASGFTPQYPEQVADVSYGIGQDVLVTSLVPAETPATVLVPSDGSLGLTWTEQGFDDSGWTAGTTGVGYEHSVPGLAVRNYMANITVGNLATAEGVLVNPAQQSSVHEENASVIDYFNTGGHGHYTTDEAAYPGTFINQDVNDFVTHVTATVTIPTAGAWTFGVNSDDGFRLTLTGAVTTQVTNSSTAAGSDTISFANPRGPGDTFGVFSFAAAGDYELELVVYERGGGAEMELFAAAGARTAFDAGAFDLVGDTPNGCLAVESEPISDDTGAVYEALIGTDLDAAMYGTNASAYMRMVFDVADPGAFDSLTLRMKYDDGFVAYLNGTEIARRNAAGEPLWDSAATAEHPDSRAVLYEDISVTPHLGLLEVGTNVLAIHGLNLAADDADFLILPELADIDVVEQSQHYFATATPGALNSTDYYAAVAAVTFNHDHGFYDAPFDVTLATDTEGAEIRYTTDGALPTLTNGTVYSTSITLDHTTVLRARGFKADHVSSPGEARTYIFLADVLTQSSDGSAAAGWPTGPINGQVLNYGMDPDIVNDPGWGPQLEEALLAIPSLSIVTDLDHLLDPTTGIYVNPSQHGELWERPVSLELIEPDGSAGFQVNAGLRIRGGYSRSTNNPKHALRFFFREEYGAAKLHYALFGEEGVDEFDKVDLRTAQNYSWSFGGDARNAMVREVFSRDLQGEMGQPYTRSRYYHLYINGQYWGLYQTQERAEASYGESYLGGERDNYDTVKCSGSTGGYTTEATDGNLDAWRDLWEQALAGLGTDAAYYRIQGLNPDGTRNTDYPALLDVDNLVDYMIIILYTGNRDAPISKFLGNERPNNWYGIRDRTGDLGFQFFAHDAEHTLLEGDLYEDRTGPFPAGDTFEYSNPQWIHQQAMYHPEYRQAFADKVHECFFNDGLITPAANQARLQTRADQIQMAIIAESARWGDSKTSTPLTKSNWESTINGILSSYFPTRTQIVLDQLRATTLRDGTPAPLYPATDAPAFNQHGGTVPDGFAVTIDAPSGTLYYTLDGTDPRLPGGGVSPTALVFDATITTSALVSQGAVWSYLDTGVDLGTAWRASGFDDSGWAAGPAQLGYGDGDEATVVSYGPDAGNKYVTTYFLRTFTATDVAQLSGLTLRLLRDDGAVVYLNGQEVARSNMPAADITYQTLAASVTGATNETTYFEFTLAPSLLVEGDNLLAVEVHQVLVNSSDLSFDLELLAERVADPPIVLSESTHIMTRALDGGEWSALTQATFILDTPPPLRVTELMYHPADPPGGSPYGEDDFEFIEIQNVGADPVSLDGKQFVDGVTFTFPDMDLAAGERIVVVSNQVAFESRYGAAGITIVGEYEGQLSNAGERVQIDGAFGELVHGFTYDDGWYPITDGDGFSLVMVDPSADPSTWDTAAGWTPSGFGGGSPGQPEPDLTSGSIAINELHY
ncbi:CotH kinase family protein, partial [bacterium]|nr:CotH kinase family protein [bacterium]